MAVAKVSLSLDEDVVHEARGRAGRRELSAYVNDAVRRQLQHDRIADLLAEMEAADGPVPVELLEEARQTWLGEASKQEKGSRRRRG